MIDAIKEAFKGLLASFVRTVVPILVALIVTTLIKIGIPVDDEFSNTITTFVSALLGGISGSLYYLVVRILEKYVPWASKLLLSNKAPVGYAPNAEVVENEVIAVPIDDVKASSETKKAIIAGNG